MDQHEKNNLKKEKDWEYQELPWKAWGSWFSWGSPIGLSLGYGISIVSTGIFLYLLHLANLIG